jgi:MFS superfamily sulfate permease-like transporter
MINLILLSLLLVVGPCFSKTMTSNLADLKDPNNWSDGNVVFVGITLFLILFMWTFFPRILSLILLIIFITVIYTAIDSNTSIIANENGQTITVQILMHLRKYSKHS